MFSRIFPSARTFRTLFGRLNPLMGGRRRPKRGIIFYFFIALPGMRGKFSRRNETVMIDKGARFYCRFTSCYNERH
ncbi:hypothetical protein DN582_01515 [Burkholderia multivorans]|nr:hypothetical protein DN497_19575 [Burkholderia multivorans]RAA92714.1 hypothetical protein DN475_06540 [Burkholderia multivorans]RAB36710.1 hypothetical protein DN501_17975 [Burkholderia multivorans]RAB91119.1 hypothetical protein DN556_02885 [Burkholderia multivorans]RAC13728.1 hypothetical protein DN573_09555 [Burkholderia multivorans]